LEIILKNLKEQEEDPPLIGDLVAYGSTVVLVVPIDSEAPKGRLILPQVQVIRECLDNGIKTVVVRETELEETIKEIQKKGVKFVLASGRPSFAMFEYAKELEMARYGGYVLAFNGGQLIDMKDGKMIFHEGLDWDDIRKIEM